MSLYSCMSEPCDLFLSCHFLFQYFAIGFSEGVKVISEALVKSVSFKDEKLQIKLKDGRVVSPGFYTSVSYEVFC